MEKDISPGHEDHIQTHKLSLAYILKYILETNLFDGRWIGKDYDIFSEESAVFSY